MAQAVVNRLKGLLEPQPAYEPIDDSASDSPRRETTSRRYGKRPFSWIEYGIFFFLGISMLWAWNMFLAAAPYLQSRFRSSKSILSSFQAAELSVSTIANLGSMLVLARLQANASYPRRIVVSLLINIVTFTLLAVSTKLFLSISASVYFAFIMIMVCSSSLATGFMQNGTFAYVAGFNRSEYMQAIMFGQAIAGVLPPIVQMVTVLSAKAPSEDEASAGDGPGLGSSTSAFSYFLTATGISSFALLAFFYLTIHRSRQTLHASPPKPSTAAPEDDSPPLAEQDHADEHEQDPMTTSTASIRQTVPLTRLARKLFYPASAVFLNFAVTMVFPVFTSLIVTTNPTPPPFLRDASFIPLALLIWNAGDLLGRLLPLVPALSLAHRPRVLLILAVLRIVFIPLYLLCNLQPADVEARHAILGATLPDAFYFIVVQFPFGLSNGFLGTCCMTGAGACVDEGEREAAGGFMALALVGGLAVGSVCSFFISVPGPV